MMEEQKVVPRKLSIPPLVSNVVPLENEPKFFRDEFSEFGLDDETINQWINNSYPLNQKQDPHNPQDENEDGNDDEDDNEDEQR